MKTEIVYVLSPNYWRYLHLSLRTLFASNKDASGVKVYCVGEVNEQLKFSGERVQTIQVEDISDSGPWGRYWGTNKLHLCRSEADRVIYLDTDVMVLGNLEAVFQGKSCDLIARLGVDNYIGKLNRDVWTRALAAEGAPQYPHYSPGFMIFQNGSHKRIWDPWHKSIRSILDGASPIPPNKHAEMYAFSIAASMAGLSHSEMEERHHRYAMIGESHEDAVVYHLGTPGFYRHYLRVESLLGLSSRTDLLVDRPPLTWAHALKTKLRHRIRRMLSNKPRESSLDYDA